jgi:hypothetical protein
MIAIALFACAIASIFVFKMQNATLSVGAKTSIAKYHGERVREDASGVSRSQR